MVAAPALQIEYLDVSRNRDKKPRDFKVCKRS